MTLCFALPVVSANAQVSSYEFSQTNGTYSSIASNGTLQDSAYNSSSSTNNLNSKNVNVTIPFTFMFNNAPQTSLNISTNGGVTFGASTSTTTTLISATTGYAGAIVVMGRDLWGVYGTSGIVTAGSNIITNVNSFYGIEVGSVLQGATGIPANTTVTAFDPVAGTITMAGSATTTSSTAISVRWGIGKIYTHTTGTAPNRKFIIEWKDFSDYSTAAINNCRFSFQLHLEETTNKIYAVYGDYTTNITSNQTNQIGLRGASNADFNNRMGTGAWTSSTAGTANNSTLSRNNTNFPASGLTYIWTPATCFAPTALTASNVLHNSATIGWTAPAVAPPSNYEYYLSTSNTAPANSATATGTVSTNAVSLSNLNHSTTYYVWVRSVCSPTDKSNWTASSLSFSTEFITAKPWNEGFNTVGVMPSGFKYTGIWEVTSSPTVPGNPGDMLMVGHGSGASLNANITTINVKGIQTNDALSFNYKFYNPTNGTPAAANAGYFKVYISNDFGQTYNLVDSIMCNSNSAWQNLAYPLNAYVGDTIKVKLESTSLLGSGTMYVLGFDNFAIEAIDCSSVIVDLQDTVICPGGTVVLDVTNLGATYSWNTGASSPTLSVTQAGIYTVAVTSGMCVINDTVEIIAAANPLLDLGSDTAICQGDTLVLVAGSGVNETYDWSNGSDQSSISVITGGNYSVTVTNTDGCSISDMILVSINPLPTATNIVTSGTAPNMNFSVTLAQNVDDYDWDFGDNSTGSNSPIPNHVFPTSPTDETYTVTLVISNDCGSDTLTTTVLIPGTTSVTDLDIINKHLNIYPNPAKDVLLIKNTSDFKLMGLSFVNVLGQNLKNVSATEILNNTINIESLPAGLYFIKLHFENGTISRKLEIVK